MSVKSGYPPPSAEGGGRPDFTLPLEISSRAILVIPVSSRHHSKRKVRPPTPLCRGGWPAGLFKNASSLASGPHVLTSLNDGMTRE